ncbi:NAD(P)/FAD-dependent oxidoreductase [Candidatus Aerophobetes bacterium]|nr:NAD(P)/FAD-dependent oxidoreductase [Candidatus Aerophobetes bacterium]
MKKKIYHVAIIGAGPAGMMAAITAAERDSSVLLLERNSCAGKKLLISGKGRCNLTNVGPIEKFLDNFPRNGKFLHSAFARFFNEELMDFFTERGLKVKVERGGRVFPESDSSKDVLNVLLSCLRKLGVDIKYNQRVIKAEKNNAQFAIFTKKNKFFSRKLVIATGGLSYPKTGSSGDGLILAKKFGHTIVKPQPALVGIEIKEKFVKKWQGLSLKNVTCSLLADGKKVKSEFGDMLFTHYGVSGPIILNLSASAYECLKTSRKVELSINFKPALDTKKIDLRLLREFKQAPNKELKTIFANLLPKRLIEEFLNYIKIDGKLRANQITRFQRNKIIKGLTDFRLTVARTRPLKEAIVTRGGVETREINPRTMESRIVRGLYFAGEVIDVDARTGGYNMQAAFSTGYICGIASSH